MMGWSGRCLTAEKASTVFLKRGYSDLFGKHGSFKEYEQMSMLSCYVLADVLLKDTRTIATWQRGVSKKANLFHDVICLSITLTVVFIHIDELWSFLRNKSPIQNIQIYSSGYDYPTFSRSTEFIDATSSFAVTPRLVGQQVLLDVSPWTDRASARDQFDTQKVPSSFRINLGEWVELGGIHETGQHST